MLVTAGQVTSDQTDKWLVTSIAPDNTNCSGVIEVSQQSTYRWDGSDFSVKYAFVRTGSMTAVQCCTVVKKSTQGLQSTGGYTARGLPGENLETSLVDGWPCRWWVAPHIEQNSKAAVALVRWQEKLKGNCIASDKLDKGKPKNLVKSDKMCIS